MLVDVDLDILVSTKEAADKCGVGESTVRAWASRGYFNSERIRVKLTPSDVDVNSRPLYKLIDVMRAARDTRHTAVGARRIA